MRSLNLRSAVVVFAFAFLVPFAVWAAPGAPGTLASTMFDAVRNVPTVTYDKLQKQLEDLPSSSWDVAHGGKFQKAKSLSFGVTQELHFKIISKPTGLVLPLGLRLII